MDQKRQSRRHFLKTSLALSGSAVLPGCFVSQLFDAKTDHAAVPVFAHLWVYASRFPPLWDCTPILDEVFSDLKLAGLAGVEIMEVQLRQNNAVERFSSLIRRYDLPVSGASYYADMWNRNEHPKILDDLELITTRLEAIGGTMLGITVGDAKRVKTETELDDQAFMLQKAMSICAKAGITPNLHNHTFEVTNNLHDLKGTLARVPEIKLGPDLNWLVRGGVDPVWFIKTYGHRMVYMHLRDQDASGKWTEAVGEGVMDFPAIAKALENMNFQGKAAIELAFDRPPQRPVRENWVKSREYVKNVFHW